MNPRKARTLLPAVAEKLEVPLEFAEDLTGFYWDTMHTTMSDLRCNHVMAMHLGTFHIKGTIKLTETIYKYNRTNAPRRNNFPKTPYRYAIFNDIENRITKLKERLKEFEDDDIRRKQIKQLRTDARLKKDMEQQETNPGGTG